MFNVLLLLFFKLVIVFNVFFQPCFQSNLLHVTDGRDGSYMFCSYFVIIRDLCIANVFCTGCCRFFSVRMFFFHNSLYSYLKVFHLENVHDVASQHGDDWFLMNFRSFLYVRYTCGSEWTICFVS